MAVGCWHPDYLFEVLTAEQWLGWLRFSEVEPLGEWRADARALALWQRIGMAFGGEKPAEIHLPTHPYVEREDRMTDDEALAELRRRKAAAAKRQREKPSSGS